MGFRRAVALLIVVGLPLVLLAWMSHEVGNAPIPGVVKGSAPKALYLHWLRPNHSSKIIKANRITFIRVFPGKKISLRLDDSIHLEGTIDMKQGEYQANLRGCYYTTTGFFDGTIQLDRPFWADCYGFSSIVFMHYLVLSTDPVGEKALRQQAWVDWREPSLPSPHREMP